MSQSLIRALALALPLAVVSSAAAQTAATPSWAALAANATRVENDITYIKASNWEGKLDVYVPRTPGPHPTILHIHGGGWVGGTRESVVLRTLPYLEMGFAVVNISYRLGQVAPAPAAVEDCLCALRWVARNAKQYNFDPARIVIMGYSAGGHLAMATGMIPPAAGLDRQCPGTEVVKPAAIVDWYGIADVAELLDGPNMKSYAVQWLGAQPNREEIAKRVVAAHIRPAGHAAHADYSRRRRSDRALPAGGEAERRDPEGGRHQRVPDDSQGRPRKLPPR